MAAHVAMNATLTEADGGLTVFTIRYVLFSAYFKLHGLQILE